MENLLEQFNTQINALLDECVESQTPTVCNLTSSNEGRKKIVELIQKKVIKEKLTIAEAIISIEMEFSVNSSDK
jgi:hypothetical protein